MARSKSFFDDVKKELECSVCQEQFSEINEPKILKCLHTFCKTCLEAWIRLQHREGELSCPTCRHITECPNSDINRLPSNLFYKQMLEIVEAYSGQGQEDSSQCGNCEQKTSLKFYCSDCNCFLCGHCAETHKKWPKLFKEHHIKEIGSFDSSDVQDYARKANVCKKHKDELRYYCDRCKICICRDCAILEHQDHNKISFEQGLEKKRSEISKRMQEVEEVGILLNQQKETLKKRGMRVNNSIDQATDEVHRFAEHCISLIRKHEATITKELLNHKTSFSSEFSSQMTALDEKMKDVNSSLEFGKDILERNNLPEILNVEETLERRFQDFLSSPEFSRCIQMNNCGVKYEPRDFSNIENELGKLSFSNTEPSLSTARGKGLKEGLQGEDCTFTIVTKDWQGKTTYNESDLVNVDIQSTHSRKVTKSTITDAKDGCYEVRYRPEDAGEFRVSITVGGETIKDSPFHLKIQKIFETSVNASRSKKKNMKSKRQLSGLTFPVKCGLCAHEEGTIEIMCVFRHRCCNVCRKNMVPSGSCTICETLHDLYSELGNQPAGHMSWRTEGNRSLQGYEDCGTLIISCNFDRGVQDQGHPNPGVPYCCFFCTFYLPDNPAGRELCILLRRAFNRRLMFTVGTSPQTKEANSIVCNGFELKTSRSGGPSNNGYPDSSYLDRLKNQLAKMGFV